MTKGRDLDDKDLKNVSGGQDIGKGKGEPVKPAPPASGGPTVPPFNAPTTGE